MKLQELKDRRKGYTSAFGYCSCREDDLDWLIEQVETFGKTVEIDMNTVGHRKSTKYDPPITTTQALVESAEEHISGDFNGDAMSWGYHSRLGDKIIKALVFELDAAKADSCYISDLVDENKVLIETIQDLTRQNEEMENDIIAPEKLHELLNKLAGVLHYLGKWEDCHNLNALSVFLIENKIHTRDELKVFNFPAVNELVGKIDTLLDLIDKAANEDESSCYKLITEFNPRDLQ